jgi:hypothetical protein
MAASGALLRGCCSIRVLLIALVAAGSIVPQLALWASNMRTLDNVTREQAEAQAAYQSTMPGAHPAGAVYRTGAAARAGPCCAFSALRARAQSRWFRVCRGAAVRHRAAPAGPGWICP